MANTNSTTNGSALGHHGCMPLADAPVLDVRPLFPGERADLLDLLTGLTPRSGRRRPPVPGWSVKDIALHLLDDELGWLSGGATAT